MRVALVTWSGLPGLSDGDGLLQAELQRRGIDAAAAVWDDASAGWDRFDAIVLRSTWDYHKRVDDFRAWLESMAALPLANPARVVLGNIDKRYLLDLPSTVPTVVTSNAHEAMRTNGWTRAVVKPLVSATAWRTEVVTMDSDEPSHPGPYLVQPFMDEVVRDGEWSFVFFGREFSHGVLKRPAAGDFRVQNDFGGSAEVLDPPPGLIAQAAAFLEGIDGPLVYARVDGVVRGGRLLLMELELTEPSLFLELVPGAAARFADAIAEFSLRRTT
jgi:glutathione synthase/RimK-type ligase-like ATP-grasp enzyme